jgi:hypothetical protein
MAKAVDIGSRSFRTQSSALEHYKSVLHRYLCGAGTGCTSASNAWNDTT